MFGEEFELLVDSMAVIYQPIGKYEIFFAHIKDGEFNYEIIDGLFGQPSPANWDESEYAQLMRKKSSDILQNLVNEGKIKIKE